jgi:predicted transcriptional regulator
MASEANVLGNRFIGVLLILPFTGEQPSRVLHLVQMSNTITVRLPDDLAEWLNQSARETGVPKGRIIREELERARNAAKRPFLRLAGAVAGPADLSTHKGFSRK